MDTKRQQRGRLHTLWPPGSFTAKVASNTHNTGDVFYVNKSRRLLYAGTSPEHRSASDGVSVKGDSSTPDHTRLPYSWEQGFFPFKAS